MKLKFPAGTLTNELLLTIMPFSSGYLLEEDNKTPLEDSVVFAVTMQSMQYHLDPLKQFDNDEYTINYYSPSNGDRNIRESTLFFSFFP